jgi:hypothetical protein
MKRQSTILELILPPNSLENESDDAGINLGMPEVQTQENGERPRIDGLTIGTLAGFDGSGAPLVTVSSFGSERPMKSLSIVVLDRTDIGRSVALQFEASDPRKPVILGVIQGPLDGVRTSTDTRTETLEKRVNVELDGERLVFTADKEIVLRCGKSSITLTRAGKVLIRGAYLLSRSSGVNRIKGGSVQIN